MGPLPRTGTVSLQVEATPEQVWALLTDITRAGEWSHENTGGEWLDGATGPVPGARFRGRNAQGTYRWTRQCEILAVDPGRSISWRTIPTRLYRDSTVWTYVLERNSGGCRITQHFEVVLLGKVMDRVLYATVPAHRDRSLALADDVRHLGERAAQLVAA